MGAHGEMFYGYSTDISTSYHYLNVEKLANNIPNPDPKLE